MNKTLPLIIAFFAVATPALNICSENTKTPVATHTTTENKPQQNTMLKELEVFQRPVVAWAIIVAAVAGPVKTIIAGALYMAILNHEKIEPVIKDAAQAAQKIAHDTHVMAQKEWKKYQESHQQSK